MSDMSEKENIGTLLRRIRKSKDLTQVEVALRSGISSNTIKHVEAGNYNVKIDTLISIAKALDAEIELSIIV